MYFLIPQHTQFDQRAVSEHNSHVIMPIHVNRGDIACDALRCKKRKCRPQRWRKQKRPSGCVSHVCLLHWKQIVPQLQEQCMMNVTSLRCSCLAMIKQSQRHEPKVSTSQHLSIYYIRIMNNWMPIDLYNEYLSVTNNFLCFICAVMIRIPIGVGGRATF